jgi:hypothetical protein
VSVVAKKNTAEIVGIASGGDGASQIYAENVIFQAERGHGFAAEKANHLLDKLSGKNASLVSVDNLKNGADRLVNGVHIQTKYCASGSKCVSECFDTVGGFRYLNIDGTPMLIEVPSDKYDDAVKALSDKISKGKFAGISDPSKAQEIIKKGGFTYEQARLIAKAGTVEGLTYDALRGIELAGGAACISAAITFSLALWNGDEFETALTAACRSGLKVGGITWISSILSAQISRTGLEQGLRSTTDWVVKQLGPRLASHIAAGAGQTIYGPAAMNYVSKLLRGNVVTAVITTLILSSADLYRLFDGRISKNQLVKNVSTIGAGVAGGCGGWQAGAVVGAAIGSAVPIVGTAVGAAVGGVVGGVVGGSAAHSVTKAVLEQFIEDDAVRMIQILENAFARQAQQYLLSQKEAEYLMDEIQSMDLPSELQNMFAASNREKYAIKLLRPHIKFILKKRKKIELPSSELLLNGVSSVINHLDETDSASHNENMSDEKQDFESDFYSFIDLAEEGDADAQFNIGNIYYNGIGVDENDKEAAVWYHKAAKQGHAAAQFDLASMYYIGQGVEENDEKAKKWYRKAAKQGHHDAQVALQRIENPFGLIQEVLDVVNRLTKR